MTVVGQEVVRTVSRPVGTGAFLNTRLVQLAVPCGLTLALCATALGVRQGAAIVVGVTLDAPFEVLSVKEDPSMTYT